MRARVAAEGMLDQVQSRSKARFGEIDKRRFSLHNGFRF
jgi:hypothetical protein